MFQMHMNKASIIDGMHALFDLIMWHIVRPGILAFTQSWWNGLVDLCELNKTRTNLRQKFKKLHFTTFFFLQKLPFIFFQKTTLNNKFFSIYYHFMFIINNIH